MGKGFWMPEWVQLDKNLSWKERMFLAEIISLDKNGEDGCYASNGWFAGKYTLAENTISEVFSSLREKGYINCEYIYRGKEIAKRITKPVYEKAALQGNRGSRKIRIGSRKTPDGVVGKHRKISTIGSTKKEEGESSATTQANADAFDSFWSAYPKKVGKLDAKKAWDKIAPDAELVGVIMGAVAKQKSQASWLKENGQYIPHPASWLNGERWTDEVEVAADADTWQAPTIEELHEVLEYRDEERRALT